MAFRTEGERYAAGLLGEPLAPEFSEEDLMTLARSQARARSQSPRLMQLLGTRGASPGQQVQAFTQSEGALSGSLVGAGLQARVQGAQARSGERRFRQGLMLQATTAGDAVREARRARGLALVQSLLSAGTTLGLGLPGIIGGAATQKGTIGLLGAERLAGLLPATEDDPNERARKATAFSAVLALLSRYLPQGTALPAGLPPLPGR